MSGFSGGGGPRRPVSVSANLESVVVGVVSRSSAVASARIAAARASSSSSVLVVSLVGELVILSVVEKMDSVEWWQQ